MRAANKKSTNNLLLYTFLGLLLAFAASVDIGGLSSKAMDNQAERTQQAVRNWGLE